FVAPCFPTVPPPPSSTLFPYTTLFRSPVQHLVGRRRRGEHGGLAPPRGQPPKDVALDPEVIGGDPEHRAVPGGDGTHHGLGFVSDRKSTRLNSSHVSISYAVFCLKKKT